MENEFCVVEEVCDGPWYGRSEFGECREISFWVSMRECLGSAMASDEVSELLEATRRRFFGANEVTRFPRTPSFDDDFCLPADEREYLGKENSTIVGSESLS